MSYVADWVLVREAEKNGLVVSMTNILERNRTELNNELRKYFREKLPNYNGIFDEDECEDVLFWLNEYIDDTGAKNYHLDFPIGEGTDIHLLKVNENIQLKILIEDEYYGSGNYSKYIAIGHFIINENTTKDDVDVLIEFVRKYLSK